MRGRPKKVMTRSSKILIRLFPQEKKMICDTAKECGMSVSDLIRCAINALAGSQTEYLKTKGD